MEFRDGQDIEKKERQKDGVYKKDRREMFAGPDPNLIAMGGPKSSLQSYWDRIAKMIALKNISRKRKIEKIYGKKEEE